MIKLSEQGIQRLLAVKKHILEEPKRLSMEDWGYQKLEEEGGPACGTVACIAGWLTLLDKPELMSANEEIFSAAMRAASTVGAPLLGLNLQEEEGVDMVWKLFYAQDWPFEFEQRYFNISATQEERAGVTAEYIDYFIAQYS